MKIHFSLTHSGFVRNYEYALRHLAAQGHQIHISTISSRNKLREKATLNRLMADCPNVRFRRWPKVERSVWSVAALAIRSTQDYIRYLDPRYKSAKALRRRVAAKTPVGGVWFATIFAHFGAWSRRACLWVLSCLDHAMPLHEAALAKLIKEKPDVFLVTPLIDVGSLQVEHLKVAKALGIPTALCVASWDNLTNKGLIREIPDRIFVWNEAQRREAIELHGAKPENVVLSGAQLFDHWFNMAPTESRETFCQKVNLNPQHPFILYIGSSRFIAPDEAVFLSTFMSELRSSSDLELRDAGVLVRPHPTNIRHWRTFERPAAKTRNNQSTETADLFRPREAWQARERQLLRFEKLAFWPPLETVPDDGQDSLWDFFSSENTLDYFHSIYHSGVVVGVNSSGMVEAGIVGRPVCAPVVPEFSHSQGGTLHFDHLLQVGGGLLYTATTMESFLQVIGERLRANQHPDPKSHRFTEAFIRPRGIDHEASPILAQEIEALAELEVVPQRFFTVFNPLRPVAYFVGWLAGRESTKRKPTARRWNPDKRRTVHQQTAHWVMYVIRPLLFVVIHGAIPVAWLWQVIAPRGLYLISTTVRRRPARVLRQISKTVRRRRRQISKTVRRGSHILTHQLLKLGKLRRTVGNRFQRRGRKLGRTVGKRFQHRGRKLGRMMRTQCRHVLRLVRHQLTQLVAKGKGLTQ